MENNANIVIRPSLEDARTRKCSRCGRRLPYEMFRPFGNHGYKTICKECERETSKVSEKFKDFTSRELIEELKHRGYEGTYIIFMSKK